MLIMNLVKKELRNRKGWCPTCTDLRKCTNGKRELFGIDGIQHLSSIP